MAEIAPYRIDCGSSVDTTDLHGNLWHQDGIYLTGGVIVTPPPPSQGTFLRPGSADSLWYETKAAQMAKSGASYGSGNQVGVKPGFRAPANGWGEDIEWILECKDGWPVQPLLWTGGFPATKPGSPGMPGGGGTNRDGIFIPCDPSWSVQAAADFNPWWDIGQDLVNSAGGFLYKGIWYPVNGLYIEPAGSAPVVATLDPSVSQAGRMTWGGRGASGLSAIGGSLRSGELDGGDGTSAITHCCKMTFPMGSYGRKDTGPVGPSGGGFTSPANRADGYYQTGYNGSQVWMGSRLVGRDQDFASVDASLATTAGHRFWRMCVDYGIYVAEDAANAPSYEIMMPEISYDAVDSSGIRDGSVRADLNIIIPQLWVLVGNNPPVG